MVYHRSGVLELEFVEPLINSALRDEFLVGADFADLPLLEHHNLVRAAYCGKPVRDDDNGAVLHQVRQRLLYQHFALRVQMAGGFVENQYGRVLQQGAGDGEALPLSAGELDAAVADHGLVAFREAHDEIVGQRGFGGGADAVGRYAVTAVGDVVRHRVIKQESVLRHQADLASQAGQAEAPHIAAVDPDAARGGVVEARHQVGDGGLPAAARSHQRHHLAGFDFQVQVLETEAFGRSGIVEAGVLEDDVLLKPGELRGAGLIHYGFPMVEVFEDLLRCTECLLEDVIDSHQPLQRFQQHEQRHDESGKGARRKPSALDPDPCVRHQGHNGEGRAEIDHRRGETLLQNVSGIVLEQALRGRPEPAGFIAFGGEGFDHHVAAQSFLKNLVELGLPVLRAAAGAPDAAAQSHGGQHHGGQHHQADQCQAPIDAQYAVQQENRYKKLAEEVGQNLRGGHLHLIDIVHDGRHQLAGGVRFEELGALFEHLVEDGVAQPRDAGESGVTDQVIADVVANSLDEEGHQKRGSDHAPGAAAERNDPVQVDPVTEEGTRQKRNRAIGGVGDEDAVEDRLNQQRHGALGGAGQSHQDDGDQNLRPVLAAIRRQAQQLLHAGTRRRCNAPSTCGTVTPAMPPSAATTSPMVRHGPHMAGSLGPKMTTEGTPKAAAMWAGPESLPTNSAAGASSDLMSESEVCRVGYARKGARLSPAAPMNTGERPDCARWPAMARKLSGAQVFSAVAATAWMTAGRGPGAGGAAPPGISFARGISPTGAPRKKMALARCSAV